MRQEIFRMERVTYMENEVIRLDNFNMQVYRGEIMGMLSVNVHGMSAFLKLLQTNLPLYDGYVYYGGEMVNSWKEPKRPHNRISIIGAKSCLVENLTVLDNVFVLRQGFGQEIIRTGLLREQLAPFLEDIGMDIPVDTCIADLPVFERVVVELLRAVVLGYRLIVLNEMGTLMSYEELDKLHEIMQHYSSQGFSFLYICPHFEEITRVCDRSVTFSNGRICKVIRKEEMAQETIRLYSETGEYDRIIRYRMEKRRENETGKKEVLRLEKVCGKYMKDITFSSYEGECLVIQIQDNDVFHEMVNMVSGDTKQVSGNVLMDDMKVRFAGNQKVAVIQELATKSMVFPELDYMNNLCICLSQRVPSIWRKRHIRNSIRREYEPILGEGVFSMSVEELSEKQKYQMVYTRILLQKPHVVFCIQPFHGADLFHRMFVWKMLEMLLNHGICVIILSLNLSDALSLADRLLIIGRDGQEEEVLKKDFASVRERVPWKHLYREEK